MRTKAALFALTLIVGVNAMGQTNSITFTNKFGEVIRDAKVLLIWPNDLFYETPGGGGRVRFTDLPPDVASRFGWRRWPLPATPITGAFGYNLGERLPQDAKPVRYFGHLWHFNTNSPLAPFRWVSIAALPDARIYYIGAGTFSVFGDDAVVQTNSPEWGRFLEEELNSSPGYTLSELATNRGTKYRFEEQHRRAAVEEVKIAMERRFGPTGPWETNFGFSKCEWGDSNRTVALQIQNGRDVTVDYIDLRLLEEANKSDEKARCQNPSVPKIPITGAFGYRLGEPLPPTLSPDDILDLSIGVASTNPPFLRVSVYGGHSGIASIEGEAPTSNDNFSTARDEIEKSYGPGSWVTNRTTVSLEWGDTNRLISLSRFPWVIEVSYTDRRLLNEAAKEGKKERMQQVNAEQKRESAASLIAFREREAVKGTAVQINGQILQVTEGGVLFKYNFSGTYNYLLCFVQDINPSGMVDEQWFGDSTVYPIGTYTYTTTGGSSKTIKKFTVSLDRAVEWHRTPH